MRLLLVGCGKMGQALLARWQARGLYDGVCVVEPGDIPLDVPQARSLADLPGGFAPDAVVFAVKPQILPDIVADYLPFAQKGALMLSIAAGRPIGFFAAALGEEAAIVRAMPNTPAAIGEGMTVACASPAVGAAQKEYAEKLLSAVGAFLWVADESLLDPVTALSGSGPAYVFLLIEALAAAGAKLGLDPGMAAALARQTVIASAALARESAGVPAATLRENVTSPGGTTAAALAVLMRDENGLQALFDEALAAAAKRARELSA